MRHRAGATRRDGFPPPTATSARADGRILATASGLNRGTLSAQQLLFLYSTFGNLTALIAAYFDTRTGVKTAPSSYSAIPAAMQVEPGQVCSFSDVVRELNPSREAGLETRLVLREGNAPVADADGHVAIESFNACF